MKRRDFLKSMLAAGVAPAFVGSSILMPVKSIVLPDNQSHIMSIQEYIEHINYVMRETGRIASPLFMEAFYQKA